MAHYKVAGAIDTLFRQVNAGAPSRDKKSDGTIASSTHTTQNPGSDHEPKYLYKSVRYVTAGDFTHDPRPGMLHCELLAAALVDSRDPRIKYIIWDGSIIAGRFGPKPWQWRTYNGSNPHTKHLHLSVISDPSVLFDDPWDLDGLFDGDDVTPDDVWSHPARDLTHETMCRTVDLLETTHVLADSNAKRLDVIEDKLDMVAGMLIGLVEGK